MTRLGLPLFILLTACTASPDQQRVPWQTGDWSTLIPGVCQQMTAVTTPEELAQAIGPHETDPLNGPGFLRLVGPPAAVQATLIYRSVPLNAVMFDVNFTPASGPTLLELQRTLGDATELPATTGDNGRAHLSFRTVQSGHPCVITAAIRLHDLHAQPGDHAEQISIHVLPAH